MGRGVPRSANASWLRLRGAKLADVESLIRFHDTLLFLRAFPQSAKVVQLTDDLLASVEAQVAKFVPSVSTQAHWTTNQFPALPARR